jgi:RHS repeat-associated protein
MLCNTNHLTQISIPTAASSTPFTRTYAYNSIGNITNKSDIGAYEYSTSTYANTHAATSVNGTTYTYDNSGNLTNNGTYDYAWDYRDRLTQSDTGSATSTYAYDQDNLRVRRTVLGSATTTYVNNYYNFSTTGTSTVISTTTAHILLPDGTPIATVEATGSATTTYWMLLDHLGGIQHVTNASGTPVESTSYYPYGDQRIASSSSPFIEQKKYTGHEYDTDSDLTYAKARYYEQDIGRFLSQDPVFNLIGDPQRLREKNQLDRNRILRDPQMLNAYVYGRNNPLTYIDSTGEYGVFVQGNISGDAGLISGFAGSYSRGYGFVTESSLPGLTDRASYESHGGLVGSPFQSITGRGVQGIEGGNTVLGFSAGIYAGLTFTNAREAAEVRGVNQIHSFSVGPAAIQWSRSTKGIWSFSINLGLGPPSLSYSSYPTITSVNNTSYGGSGSTNINELSSAVIDYAQSPGADLTDSGFAAALRAINNYNSSL